MMLPRIVVDLLCDLGIDFSSSGNLRLDMHVRD